MEDTFYFSMKLGNYLSEYLYNCDVSNTKVNYENCCEFLSKKLNVKKEAFLKGFAEIKDFFNDIIIDSTNYDDFTEYYEIVVNYLGIEDDLETMFNSHMDCYEYTGNYDITMKDLIKLSNPNFNDDLIDKWLYKDGRIVKCLFLHNDFIDRAIFNDYLISRRMSSDKDVPEFLKIYFKRQSLDFMKKLSVDDFAKVAYILDYYDKYKYTGGGLSAFDVSKWLGIVISEMESSKLNINEAMEIYAETYPFMQPINKNINEFDEYYYKKCFHSVFLEVQKHIEVIKKMVAIVKCNDDRFKDVGISFDNDDIISFVLFNSEELCILLDNNFDYNRSMILSKKIKEDPNYGNNLFKKVERLDNPDIALLLKDITTTFEYMDSEDIPKYYKKMDK